MCLYPGRTVLERAQNALAANPKDPKFIRLYNFILNYSVSYTKKNGRVYKGRYGVDGAVKAYDSVMAACVVR